MSRKFKTADYEATLNSTVTLRECLPPDHLARFIVDVIAQLDLSAIYAHYGPRGGEAIAPEVLLGLLFYGYATGTFSARKIERATYESMPFHFLAGGLHPDHDTIANFRTTFLPELKDFFVHILLYAQEIGVLTLGNISLDGTTIRADASKSSAISSKRLLELDSQLRTSASRPARCRRGARDTAGGVPARPYAPDHDTSHASPGQRRRTHRYSTRAGGGRRNGAPAR